MSWRAWTLIAWTGVVFVFATLLLSNTVDARSASRASDLSFLQVLTMPIGESKPSDLRMWVLPLGLAGLFLIFAAFPRSAPPAPKKPSRRKNATMASGEPLTPQGVESVKDRSWRADYWLEIAAGALIAIAIASTTVNDTWRLSREWLLQLAAGCGWAILLSRWADRRCFDRILLAGSFVAVCAVVMSFAHRRSHYVEYFAWPIGPVTLTAGMGAVWASAAMSNALGMLPRSARADVSRRNILWTIVMIVASFALLIVAARRGAWLAVLAAAGYSTILVILKNGRAARTRWLVFTTIAALTALTAAYIVTRSRSSDPLASVPITYRLIYWKNTVEHLSDHWLFGHGPDMFICKMSAIIGRQRGHMPRILHGTIDPEAHNEWLQAMFELGLPGGLLYLAIPLVAIALATRAWLRGVGTIRPATLLCCAAGLTAILVSEAGSVCLRRGGMNVWYWTLIGVTVAGTRRTIGPSAPRAASARHPWTLRVAALAAAAAICTVVVHDGRCRIAHVRGVLEKNRDDRIATQWLTQALGRLGAWQAMAARTDLSDAQLALATSLRRRATGSSTGREPSPESIDWAVQAAVTLRELNEWCPAYPGAACRLADALMLAGDLPGACDVLNRYVTQIDAYDMPANYLTVTLCPLEPRETVEVVRRALRDGEWMSPIAGKVAAAFKSPGVLQDWQQEVLAAIKTVQEDPASRWADTLAPETFRVEAARFASAGDAASAARIQSIAVRAYARLVEENSPYRRSAFAEADASLQLARFSFASDPSKTSEAFQILSQAEQFAVQCVPQRPVIDADPRSEWVGGKVIPAQFPPRLRPLWRFSAMMHLAIGGNDRWAYQRMEWSLPEENRTPQRMARELGALSSELVAIYQRLDPDRRPPTFDGLVSLANQYGPRPAVAPGR